MKKKYILLEVCYPFKLLSYWYFIFASHSWPLKGRPLSVDRTQRVLGAWEPAAHRLASPGLPVWRHIHPWYATCVTPSMYILGMLPVWRHLHPWYATCVTSSTSLVCFLCDVIYILGMLPVWDHLHHWNATCVTPSTSLVCYLCDVIYIRGMLPVRRNLHPL